MPSDAPVPVSVVVASYRRPERLKRLLAALERQDHRPLEVVVVDDASGDGTPDVVRDFSAVATVPVRLVVQERNTGPAGARNAGWRLAAHDLVAFTDDDCVPRPGWLTALARRGAVVAGRTIAAPDQEAQRGVFSRTLEVTDSSLGQTCNVLYPRAVLEELGGFDGRLRTGEDTDLLLRARAAGHAVAFEADAVVEHDVRPSSLRAAVLDAWHWYDLPGVVARHPELRGQRLHHRLWWKPAHPPALLALSGLLAARRRPWAAILVVPWLHRRWLTERVEGVGPRRRLASLPGQLLVDLVEVSAMVRGSAKHRTLVL